MFGLFTKSTRLPTADEALPGRHTPLATASRHAVTGAALHPPYPDGTREVVVAMGCFWGAERLFWREPGVVTTAVGYAGGHSPNPTYEEVCSGRTGHAEVVRVVYDPAVVALERLLQIFWESHDPTQGMRQGNDVGTQYRSAIYTTDAADAALAEASRRAYQGALDRAGKAAITTEIRTGVPFYFAEDYHQQYLHKVPHGYCGLAGTGVACPTGAGVAAS
ncbi:MAG: peptide-methionine (S)-S-oxide reductase MsrA [Alphaproteobacteria bacterium]